MVEYLEKLVQALPLALAFVVASILGNTVWDKWRNRKK